jgi:hypothetical protein
VPSACGKEYALFTDSVEGLDPISKIDVPFEVYSLLSGMFKANSPVSRPDVVGTLPDTLVRLILITDAIIITPM